MEKLQADHRKGWEVPCRGNYQLTKVQRESPLKKGSLRKSGEGGADLEEEVLVVAIAAGHALDDPDAVVDTLDQAGVQPVSTDKNN